MNDEGEFTCRATNVAGQEDKNFQLQVHGMRSSKVTDQIMNNSLGYVTPLIFMWYMQFHLEYLVVKKLRNSRLWCDDPSRWNVHREVIQSQGSPGIKMEMRFHQRASVISELCGRAPSCKSWLLRERILGCTHVLRRTLLGMQRGDFLSKWTVSIAGL